MTLPRLIVRRDVAPGHAITPEADQVRHLRDVLRLRPGDVVVVVDGAGSAWRAEVADGEGFALRVVARETEQRAVRSGLHVTLVMALLKGDHTELAVQKATEAGVAEVRVAVCERSIPRVRAADLGRRVERLARVAREAARQSGRADVPVVTVASDLGRALDGLGEGARFRLDEAPGTPSLAAALAAAPAAAVTLAVGPEGSFSPAEAARLDAAGFAAAGLGPRVLRAETAAMAAVVVAQALCGDWR